VPTEGTPSPAPEVVDASVPADWVRPGIQTTIRATIRNPGPERRTIDLEVTHDDVEVATATVTLRANATRVYAFQVVFSEPRKGQVAVNGVRASSLTVSATDDTPTGVAGTTGDGGSLPGFVVLFAAVVWVGYLGLRRDGGH